MIKVVVKADSRYQVDRKKIKQAAVDFLKARKISGPVEVGVDVVGDRKIQDLNSRFRNRKEPCLVLAFPLENGVRGGFVNPPDKVLRLGDIVLSYPQAVKEAAEENVFVAEKIKELIEHGLKHLLGLGE